MTSRVRITEGGTKQYTNPKESQNKALCAVLYILSKWVCSHLHMSFLPVLARKQWGMLSQLHPAVTLLMKGRRYFRINAHCKCNKHKVLLNKAIDQIERNV